VRRFYEEVWARGNVEFAQEVFAEDYLRHDLRPTAAAPGPQGQQQIAAAFSGVNIFRIRDGKVAEIWNHRDDLGLAQQLGAPVYAGAPPQDD
jgi:predicted SnoaL-like aldol condensation-catalyzing enzyme